jgi:Cytochrome P450
MDQLNALPYLDMVVRESLRVHPPVAFTNRVSMKDNILPLSKPVVDRNGRVHHTIRKVLVDLRNALLSLIYFFQQDKKGTDNGDPDCCCEQGWVDMG